MGNGSANTGTPRWSSNAATAALQLQLLQVWSTGSDTDVFRFLNVHIAPRLHTYLEAQYDFGLGDREDCIAQAFERFLPAVTARHHILNPYNYFFTIANNEALLLLRRRQREPIDFADDPEVAALLRSRQRHGGLPVSDDADPPDPPEHLALELVEDAAAELEVEPYWAVEVIREVVARLPPARRHLAEVLMRQDYDFERDDFEYSSARAGEDLDLNKGAFRTQKSRLYQAIRELVPQVIVEMGIHPPERAEAAVFPEGRGTFLDEK